MPLLKSLDQAQITSLAPGGEGVAHGEIDGERRAVFVPFSAPGDRVRLAVDASRRPARGRVIELLAPGADRVPSACRWSNECGGCDWIHLSLEAQQRIHVEHVRAALPAAWRGTAIAAHACTLGLAYRTRARVHAVCGRAGRVTVGMHGVGTHDPVEVETCVVLDPSLEDVRKALGAFFRGGSGRGEINLALGAGRVPVIDVRWDGQLNAETFARLERAVGENTLAGARIVAGQSRRPAQIGDPTPWTTGADGGPLRLSPGGFAQASEEANLTLGRYLAELVRPLNVERAVELYAGAGNLSVVLSGFVREMVCVESERAACDAARTNLAARGLHARVHEGDAGAYDWSPSTRLVVVDPPRTGARAVAERLSSSRVAHVVYVSCDPQTLGRDLAILERGYALRSIATFEMFPQTSHVETVVHLARQRS